MGEPHDATIIVFSKEQVRHFKLAHFLKRFGTDALPAGPELAKLMGTCQFLIQGWDDDPQELYAIPGITFCLTPWNLSDTLNHILSDTL